jgi:hypothetical protein
MNEKERVERDIRGIMETTRAAVIRAESLHDIDLIKKTAMWKLDLLREQQGGDAADPEVFRRIEAARRDL